MARRRHSEEHERHEAWAIPYGDLVTLLLAFFVVMYSISSVNEGKYRVVSDSLTEAFHGTPHSPQPITLGQSQAQPIEQQLPLTQVNRMFAAGLPTERQLAQAVSPPAPKQAEHATASAAGRAPPPSAAPAAPDHTAAQAELTQVAADVGAALRALIQSGQVTVHQHDTWVGVDISTDILFDSGVARLSPKALSVMQRLADTLKPWPNAIRVEGHTDDRRINTSAFPSNWELSAARAASVVHLFMDRGVAPGRMAVLGFGPYRPVAANSSATGRNANRRVELVILSRDSAPEEGL